MAYTDRASLDDLLPEHKALASRLRDLVMDIRVFQQKTERVVDSRNAATLSADTVYFNPGNDTYSTTEIQEWLDDSDVMFTTWDWMNNNSVATANRRNNLDRWRA